MPRTVTDDTLHVLLDWVPPDGLIEVVRESTSTAVVEMAAVNGYTPFVASDGTLVLLHDDAAIVQIRDSLALVGVAYIEPQEA